MCLPLLCVSSGRFSLLCSVKPNIIHIILHLTHMEKVVHNAYASEVGFKMKLKVPFIFSNDYLKKNIQKMHRQN